MTETTRESFLPEENPAARRNACSNHPAELQSLFLKNIKVRPVCLSQKQRKHKAPFDLTSSPSHRGTEGKRGSFRSDTKQPRKPELHIVFFVRQNFVISVIRSALMFPVSHGKFLGLQEERKKTKFCSDQKIFFGSVCLCVCERERERKRKSCVRCA